MRINRPLLLLCAVGASNSGLCARVSHSKALGSYQWLHASVNISASSNLSTHDAAGYVPLAADGKAEGNMLANGGAAQDRNCLLPHTLDACMSSLRRASSITQRTLLQPCVRPCTCRSSSHHVATRKAAPLRSFSTPPKTDKRQPCRGKCWQSSQ